LAAAHRAGDPHRALGLARPHPRDEAIGRPVGEADRVGLVVERQRRQNRAEHLLLHDRMAARRVAEHCRSDVKTALGRLGVDRALGERLHAVGASAGDIAFHARFLPRVDHRAHVEILIVRAGAHPGEALCDDRGEFFISRALDQHARARRAGLAAVLDDGVDDRRRRRFDVGVGEDELRRLAAQLQRAAGVVARRRRLDRRPGLRTAGE
jgi:hypothetical protein